MGMNISDVVIFNKVAATLSFTRAAMLAGSSRSTVSKKINRLEGALGVILINRSTRSVTLTEAGRDFYSHTSEIDLTLEHAADLVRGSDLQPSGTVKLSLPSSFGAMFLPSLITQFQKSWPEIIIDIHVEDHEVDLIAGAYELAILVSHKLKDSNLISQRLGSTPKVLAASPAYLKKFGMPRSLQDLKNHRCLGFGCGNSNGTAWRFDTCDKIVEVRCTFPVTTDNAQALIDAARCDNGIIYVPRAYITDELTQKRLEHILPDSHVPESYGIFAVYPHRKVAAKVKVLVDFIDQEMKSQGIADQSVD